MAAATETVFQASPTTGSQAPALAAPWLFTGEDNLELVVANSAPSVVVSLVGRFASLTDPTPTPFLQTLTPTSDRMPNVLTFGLGPCWLLNCSVFVSAGSPSIGQTYAMVRVIRGLTGATIVLGSLLGGYVTAQQAISYPGSPIVDSISGGGYLRIIQGTKPAAGAEISESQPTGARWKLLNFVAFYTASAAVATRDPYLQLWAGGSAYAASSPSAPITANEGESVEWAPTLPTVAIPAASLLTGGIAFDPYIFNSGALKTVTANLQSGDQWSAPTYAVREWLEVN